MVKKGLTLFSLYVVNGNRFLILAAGLFLMSACTVYPHKWRKKVHQYHQESYEADTVYIADYFMCSVSENHLWRKGEPKVIQNPLPCSASDVFEPIYDKLKGKVTVLVDAEGKNRCSYAMSKNNSFEMSRNIQREVVFYFPQTDGKTRLVPYLIFTIDDKHPSKEKKDEYEDLLVGIQVAVFLVTDEKIIYLNTSETKASWSASLEDQSLLKEEIQGLLSLAISEFSKRM
jgi:hypothetical protein